MTEIARVTNNKAVGFDSVLKGLPKGQVNIMKMLTEHLKSGKPITKEDIAECYALTTAPTGFKRMQNYKRDPITDEYKYVQEIVKFDKDHWQAKWYSINWFKSNLGACILRGKLLAIPVIDMDDKSIENGKENKAIASHDA